IAQAQGEGSLSRKLTGLVGLLEPATALEARYLVRTVTGALRLGIGTATILDALAQVHAGGRSARPVLERAYSICSDLSLVTATLTAGGLPALERMQVRAGRPVRPVRPQRLSDSGEILAKLGGACAAEYKYDGIRVQAHRTAGTGLELFTRRLERVSTQFPEVVQLLERSLGPREAILEGEVVAADPASGELRPFQEVMFRRRKYGIAEAVGDYPVSMFCFDLLYADGEGLTRLPYLERRARAGPAAHRPGRPRRPRGSAPARRPPRPPPGGAPAAGSRSSSSATTAPSCPTPWTWWWWAPTPAADVAPASTGHCCWPSTTPPATGSRPSATAAPVSPTPTSRRCPLGWHRWRDPTGPPAWTHAAPRTRGSHRRWWGRAWQRSC